MTKIIKQSILYLSCCLALTSSCIGAYAQEADSTAAQGNETNSSTNATPYLDNTTAITGTQTEATNMAQYGLLAPGSVYGSGSIPSGTYSFGFGAGVPSMNGGFTALPATATSSVDLNITDDNAGAAVGATSGYGVGYGTPYGLGAAAAATTGLAQDIGMSTDYDLGGF